LNYREWGKKKGGGNNTQNPKGPKGKGKGGGKESCSNIFLILEALWKKGGGKKGHLCSFQPERKRKKKGGVSSKGEK